MRLLLALLAGLALAGCGTETEGSPVPASSGPIESSGGTETSPPALEPPVIVLASVAGKQIATRGSYCITAVDPSSGQNAGRCADSTWPHPDRVTVVKPGDGVSLILSDAQVRGNGTVTVLPYGCEQTIVKTIPLNARAQSTAFAVDLDPGAYELQVFTRFSSDDGRRGDVSGGLGLVVADDRSPTIEPGPPRRSNC